MKSFIHNQVSLTLVLLTQVMSSAIAGDIDPDKIYPVELYERHSTLINKEIILPQLSMKSSMKLKGTCGNHGRCEIGITGDRIFTSSGINIKGDNMIGWSLINATNPGGFPQFWIRTGDEDYRFLIKYFNRQGKKAVSEIGFYNYTSAQTFMSSLELISGLAPNHDQSGQATKCTASGKNQFSGSGSIGTYSRKGKLSRISLNRNVISEVRKAPASSKDFLDDSFAHRDDCIDESLNKTNVDIKSTAPLPVFN